jgi:hypothetical protein
MVASINRIQSALNFVLNQIFIDDVSKYLDCDIFPNNLIAILMSSFWQSTLAALNSILAFLSTV